MNQAKRPMPSVSRLEDCLAYDETTGALTWKKTISPRARAGFQAGTVNKAGYAVVFLDGVPIRAHRAGWALWWGEWPTGQLDHINGLRADNRLSNLRLASPSQNSQNRRVQSNNKLGVKGVIFDKQKQAYRADISREGRRSCLGYFDSAEAAGQAYDAAAAQIHGEFARGNA